MMRRLGQRYVDDFLLWEGSTRSVAILRILLVLLLWDRFGEASMALDRNAFDGARLGFMALFWVSTTLLLIGFHTRVAAVLVAVVASGQTWFLAWAYEIDELSRHHVYTLGVYALLMAFTPCGRSYSVDRWLALKIAERDHQPPPEERGPLWGLRLVCIMVSVMYVSTAWEKSYWAYVDGSAMEMVWLTLYFGSDVALFTGFHALTVLASGLVLALEWMIGFGLWSRRWRLHWIALGVFLHGSIYWFIPVATFTTTMMALYIAFFDPDEVHRFTEQVS